MYTSIYFVLILLHPQCPPQVSLSHLWLNPFPLQTNHVFFCHTCILVPSFRSRSLPPFPEPSYVLQCILYINFNPDSTFERNIPHLSFWAWLISLNTMTSSSKQFPVMSWFHCSLQLHKFHHMCVCTCICVCVFLYVYRCSICQMSEQGRKSWEESEGHCLPAIQSPPLTVMQL